MNMKQLFFGISMLFAAQLGATVKVWVVPAVETQLSTIGIDKASDDIFKTYYKSNPQIIVWFSGEDVLTKRCSEFYKKLFNSLKLRSTAYCLYLYDLYSWAGLKNDKKALLLDLKIINPFKK